MNPPEALNRAESQLSQEQLGLEKLWEEHVASEFKVKSVEAAINIAQALQITMSDLLKGV